MHSLALCALSVQANKKIHILPQIKPSSKLPVQKAIRIKERGKKYQGERDNWKAGIREEPATYAEKNNFPDFITLINNLVSPATDTRMALTLKSPCLSSLQLHARKRQLTWGW